MHTCGLTADGAAYCWGDNYYGELGTTAAISSCYYRPYSRPCAQEPAPVVGGALYAGLTVGYAYTCALTKDRYAYCWGLNDRGQLGDGTTTNRATPVRVANP